MTAAAITTARQVKTRSRSNLRWTNPPNELRLPSSLSKINPVATGGMTSGIVTMVSTIDFPTHRRFARSQAMPIPKGKINIVLRLQASRVKRSASQSSGDNHIRV